MLAAATRSDASSLLDKIKAGYAADEWLKKPENRKLCQKKDGLHRMGTGIYVPAGALRTEITRQHHCPPYAGHVGVTKTTKAVQRTFWWPQMRQEIRAFVRSCDECQRNKADCQAKGGLLQPLDIPDRKWAHVTMDAMVELAKTPRGHDAIIVMVDKLTKMVHFAPTTSSFTAADAAEIFVNKVISVHGLPTKIITDRGQNFNGEFWQEICRIWGVEKAASTAFHPQSDGQSEKTNDTLQVMLRHYVTADHTDWDKHLPAAEFAVNNSWHETLQSTPFFLNYGQHPLTPVTLQTDDKVPAARVTAEQLTEHIERARKCLKIAQDRQKTYADKNRRHVEYQVGQEVLLSSKNITFQTSGSRKFLPKFIGPFKVDKLVGKVAVKLQLPSTYRIHPVFHVSLLRPYNRTEHTRTPPPPTVVDSQGLPEYKVDAIVGHREKSHRNKKRWEFLIKWQGYGPEHNSWEMEWDVGTPLIQAYWDSLGGEPGHSQTKAQAQKKTRPAVRKQTQTLTPEAPARVVVGRRRHAARSTRSAAAPVPESQTEPVVTRPVRQVPKIYPKPPKKAGRISNRRGRR
jgi:hypothetical protein